MLVILVGTIYAKMSADVSNYKFQSNESGIRHGGQFIIIKMLMYLIPYSNLIRIIGWWCNIYYRGSSNYK